MQSQESRPGREYIRRAESLLEEIKSIAEEFAKLSEKAFLATGQDLTYLPPELNRCAKIFIDNTNEMKRRLSKIGSGRHPDAEPLTPPPFEPKRLY